jgi:hypothetical protein
MPQDPATREPYPEAELKKKWPRTYSYLLNFKDILLSRGSKTVREFAERTAFYAMFGIGPYTVARYKTVWKRMSNDITASVIAQHKTPYGFKMIIPTDTTSLFATQREDEAHYLCAILNSSLAREYIKSFSSAGRGFGAPSVMKHLHITQYDRKSAIDRDLSRLSKEAHDFSAENNDTKSFLIEREVDAAMESKFSIAEK